MTDKQIAEARKIIEAATSLNATMADLAACAHLMPLLPKALDAIEAERAKRESAEKACAIAGQLLDDAGICDGGSLETRIRRLVAERDKLAEFCSDTFEPYREQGAIEPDWIEVARSMIDVDNGDCRSIQDIIEELQEQSQ